MIRPAPPGEILQLLYLQERLQLIAPRTFIEVGPGRGAISRLLLNLGWRGVAYELGEDSAAEIQQTFCTEIAQGQYKIIAGDWLSSLGNGPAELVVSCMVMEHLDHRMEAAFMRHAAASLSPGGRMIGFVPAAPQYWGIEDDIAGHHRRYTREALQNLMARTGWRLTHVAGLTYPLSNLLLPISNRLVKRAEQKMLELSRVERTVRSGRRNVPGKTHFPAALGLLLNSTMMRPFHWLQKWCRRSENALVIYFEAEPGA